MKILISIIIPIYKVEKYIDRCVQSVINQDYQNIEIILVDDGSPDNCPKICDDYVLKDKRIRAFHKGNGGLSDARNYGITKASGDYIIFVDSDDYIQRDTCSNFIRVIKDREVDIVVGNAKILQDKNKRDMFHKFNTNGKCVTGKEYMLHEFQTKTMHMAVWLNIYSTKFLLRKNLKFKVGLLHEDEQFTPRAFLLAENVIGSEIVFYNYIIRENSITTQKNKTKNAECIVQICKELENIYDNLEDGELKYLLKEHLVNIYFKCFYLAKLYKKELKYLVDIDFLHRNARSKKNKFRVMILKFSKKVYYVIYAIYHSLNS